MKGNLVNDLLKLMLIAVSIILVCIVIIFVDRKVYNNDNSTVNNSATYSETSKSNSASVISAKVSPLEYFEEVEKTSTKSTIKDGFVKIVDFIFYGEKINGTTFSELKDDIKLKIINIAYKIDSKIDSWFPGYKDTIKNAVKRVYTKIKERLTELYIKITNKICDAKPTLCETAREDFKVMKEKFGITYEYLKELFQKGKDKVNDWYLEFRDK